MFQIPNSILTVLLTLAAASVAAAQPTITSISPINVAAGTATFTLYVFGTGFAPGTIIGPGSTVKWNGTTSLPTTYVSPLQLRATVSYTLIANQGIASVTVENSSFTPSPGTSIPRLFPILAPLPVGISHLNPASVVAGNGTFTLFVYGNGFQQGGGLPYIPPSVVTWNGNPLNTTYVSFTLGAPYLRAPVPASLVTCGGTAQVRVLNPTPTPVFGSDTWSNIVNFTITPAASMPSIASMSPSSTVAGGPSFTMTVNGCNFTISYTNFGPISIPNYPVVLLDGAALNTSWVSSTQLTASVPASMIAAARTAQVRVRNYLSQSNFADSPPAAFGILAPDIASLAPASLPPMTAASPPVPLVVTGSRFLPGAVIHADGLPLATTYVSTTELRADVGPSLIQTQRPGGIAINVANAVEAVSNTVPLVMGSGSNQGTIRRQPLNPQPGQAYVGLLEGGHPSGLVSVIADVLNPPPLAAWPDPVVNMVLSVATTGGAIPLVDGFGLFSPATGATLDANGSFTIPGFILPNPAYGISLTIQAVYLDPAAAAGFNLTWARFPDML